MGAVVYRLASGLRHRWASTVAVTLLVAVVFGVVITVAAGAHRTATAPDRYTSSSQVEADGIVTQDGGRPRTDEIADLDGVASVDSVTFVFGSVTDPNGARTPDDGLVFSGSPRAIGMRLVHGRDTDPDNAKRVRGVAELRRRHPSRDRRLVRGRHVHPTTSGRRRVRDAEPRRSTSHGHPRRRHRRTNPARRPDAARRGVAGASPSTRGRRRATLTAVDLRDGVDLSQLRAQLDTLPDSQGLSLDPADVDQRRGQACGVDTGQGAVAPRAGGRHRCHRGDRPADHPPGATDSRRSRAARCDRLHQPPGGRGGDGARDDSDRRRLRARCCTCGRSVGPVPERLRRHDRAHTGDVRGLDRAGRRAPSSRSSRSPSGPSCRWR